MLTRENNNQGMPVQLYKANLHVIFAVTIKNTYDNQKLYIPSQHEIDKIESPYSEHVILTLGSLGQCF